MIPTSELVDFQIHQGKIYILQHTEKNSILMNTSYIQGAVGSRPHQST